MTAAPAPSSEGPLFDGSFAWVEHPLHGAERTYRETNCFADAMIELVTAAGGDPTAMFGIAVALDFEVDQWTFLKTPPEDLRRLYGIDIREMLPVGPLPSQIATRLAAGQTLMPELDAWFLPDTMGTSYHAEHVKTSVVAVDIDPSAETFSYLHNSGCYALSGDDYRGVFRLDPDAGSSGAWVLPPYVDLVRFDAGELLRGEALKAQARTILREHMAHRPVDNPFDRFGRQLALDLPDLLAGDLDRFHEYAFVCVRMAGASFELLASHVRWLYGDAGEVAAVALDELVAGSKVLSFRLARRRAFDVDTVVQPLGAAWSRAQRALDVLA